MVHPDAIAPADQDMGRQQASLRGCERHYISATYSLVPSGERSQLCFKSAPHLLSAGAQSHMSTVAQAAEVHLRVAFVHVRFADEGEALLRSLASASQAAGRLV